VEQPFVQENPGETGKLAWWGKAVYTKVLQVESLEKDYRLEVDGAFSNARVYVNGEEAGRL
jgi:beta-galactosidase